MPRWSATRRASWMSCPAQQAPLRPIAAPWSYSCSVTPTTSWPASCSKPATVLLSTPPDIATRMRIALIVHHVAGAGRQLDHQAIQRLGHDDLAAKARGLGQAECQVQHVLLILGRFAQLAEPGGVNDDVASGAGERALARALDVHAMLMGNLQHRQAKWRVHFAACAAALDEGHFRHGQALAKCSMPGACAPSCAAASAAAA